MRRVRWSIVEVLKAIHATDQYWQSTENASWCRRHILPPEESEKWDRYAEEALNSLRKMGLDDLIESIKRVR